ncbi:MAG: hypothetical protein Q7S19_03715 [bacterium]|nr:hypothetical protein [bacterium]
MIEQNSMMETKKLPSVSKFSVSEEINPDNYLIRIKITSIDRMNNTLEAIVTRAGGYFSEDYHGIGDGCPQDGFKKGMELKFRPNESGNWDPEDKAGVAKHLPWFELMITEEGKKRFVHP